MIYQSKIEEVKKGWGKEKIITNLFQYCGKLLEFNAHSVSSAHFHIKKRETFYVLKGQGYIEGVNPQNAEKFTLILEPGTVIEIPVGAIHQVHATTEMTLIEFSTEDFPYDSYRVSKGDSQK